MERCCSVREVLSLLRRWFTSCFSGQMIRRLATDCQLRHAVSHAVSNSELTELTPAGSEPPVLVALLTRYACRWTYDGAVLYWSFCELSRPTNQSADLLQVQQRSIGHPLCTCRLACSHTLNKDRQHSLKPQNLCKIWYQQLRDGFVTAPSQPRHSWIWCLAGDRLDLSPLVTELDAAQQALRGRVPVLRPATGVASGAVAIWWWVSCCLWAYHFTCCACSFEVRFSSGFSCKACRAQNNTDQNDSSWLIRIQRISKGYASNRLIWWSSGGGRDDPGRGLGTICIAIWQSDDLSQFVGHWLVQCKTNGSACGLCKH